MKKIFKTIGSVVLKLSMIIGFVVLVLAIIGLFSFVNLFSGDEDTKPLPKHFAVFHEFNGMMPDIQGQSGFLQGLFGQDIDLIGVIQSINKAKTDDRVMGIAVNIKDGDYSLTQIQSIRKAVLDFNKSGKKSIAYSEGYGNFSNGLGEYWLASAFTEIWLQPVGLVSLNGIRIEQPYASDVLEKIGVEPEIIQRKSYKTGPETYLRDGMSDASKETLIDISQSMMGVILGDISAARNLPLADVANAVNLSPLTDQDALKMGLIDKIGYTDEIESMLKTGDKPPKIVSLNRYNDETDEHDDDAKHAKVATVMVEGMIMADAMASQTDLRAMLVPSNIAEASKIASGIMNAADNENIKVIVMRINSPGGSPSASETIRRAVVYARSKGKYVIASMGDVAASGGYWVASNANQIIASNLTITGSIGVYGGKMNLSGLWNKIGVNWDSVEIGQNASMWSMNTGYKDTELARLNVMMDDIYDAFVERVAKGRNMSIDDTEIVAQGRAWMGDEARDKNLVDLNGGFEFALKRAAGEAGGLDWMTMPIMVIGKGDDPFAEIMDLMGVKTNIKSPLRLPQSLAPMMVQDAIVSAPVLGVQF